MNRNHLTVEDLRAWSRRQGWASIPGLNIQIARRAKEGAFWLFRADDRVQYIHPAGNSQGFTSMSYRPGSPAARQLWERLRVEDELVRAGRPVVAPFELDRIAHEAGAAIAQANPWGYRSSDGP